MLLLLGIARNKMMKTLIYLVLLGTLSTRFMVSSGSCNVAPFPLIIGGTLSDTYLDQIDYHAPT